MLALLPLMAAACGGGGDGDDEEVPQSRAELTFSKIMVGVIPNGSETLEVTALDERALPDTWTVSAKDESIATVSKAGTQLTIVGVAPGDTSIAIRSKAGVARELPVKVYDPSVLDVGDLLIRYVDRFAWRWDDSGSGGDDDGAFWHPVVPEGWHALGSLGIRGYGDANAATPGYWMLVVKEDGASGALARPLDYRREYDDDESGATDDGSFWTPVCPAGFVALGAVAQSGWGKPNLDDVVCVRENLTVLGAAGDFIWDDSGTGARDWVGMWRIDLPARQDWSDRRMYLDPGTFVATGSEGGICTQGGCWSAPAAYPHMNILAVEAPLLFEADNTSFPRLASYEKPAAVTEPFEARAMLVPFSAILSGSQIRGHIHQYVTESPFVRLEKSARYHQLGWIHCVGSTTCPLEYTVEKGITKTTSETFSHTVGVALTIEGGVSLLGTGGKASASVSYQFGYQTSESRAVFSAQSWTASKPCPGGSACAIWTDSVTFEAKRHVPGAGLAVLSGGEISFDGGVAFWTGEYPEP
jgi:hypothetical protein